MRLLKSLACLSAVSLSLTAFATPKLPLHQLAGQTYDGMVVFGDSLSDASADGSLKQGNNRAVVTTESYYDTTSGTAKTVKTSAGAPITNDGYQSKALLWDNDLLSILQAKGIINNHDPLTPVEAKNALTTTPTNFNYAFASAETGDNYLNDLSTNAYPPYEPNCTKPGLDSATGVNCVPGVLKQIALYLQDHQSDAHFKDRLYIIFAGGNDMFNNITKMINKDDKDQSNYTGNLITAVKELHVEGVPADHILLIGIPEIAKAPAASVFLADNPAFEGVFNTLIETQNSILYSYTKDEAMWFDVGALVRSITKAPYEFKDTAGNDYTLYYTGGAMLAADKKYYPQDCATTAADHADFSAQTTVCENTSNQYKAFFNDKHPSAMTHLAIAMDIYQKLFA